jgi:hypothetical protein
MRICDSCISHIKQQIDEYNGQETNLVAYNCRNPMQKDGKLYGCYYFFMNYCLKNYNQPERSKREDLETPGIAKLDYEKINSASFCPCSTEMRCSEHCGNTVREAK